MNETGQVSRRQVLLFGGLLTTVAAGLSACSGSSTPAGPASSASTEPSGSRGQSPRGSPGGSASPSTSTSPPGGSPALPSVSRWLPNAGDVDPQVKGVAADLLEVIGTWQARRGGTPAAARSRAMALGMSGPLIDQVAVLLSPRARSAVLEVIEAQYGGILASSASVLVACRQWRGWPDGSVSVGGTTVDVRLERTPAARWNVTALHPARPGGAQATPSDLARKVLDDPRIELPPAAAADVASGQVHDSVLAAMVRLAATYRIGVSVIRSGHPIYVFGTDRRSDHPLGRAFDTFRIDGRLVVDPATPRDLITGYMTAAARAGSYNVGGPYLLPGSGNRFFSDATHHDHVHAGFAT